MRTTKPFDAVTVSLQGSNLIEASAGTGKTYSIAIPVLRLILEEKLPVKEILMVTFTKAAVAELEERIRLFIRSAYKVSLGENISDDTITRIVNGYGDVTEARRLLREAVLFLDETSVLTIHSFCQKTLHEFAFETNQLFGAETIQDISTILEEEINRFWRKNVTTINPELLAPLLLGGLTRESIKAVVREHLSGKKYFPFVPGKKYAFQKDEHLVLIESIKDLEEKENALRDCIVQRVVDHSDRLKTVSEQNRYARKGLLQLIDTPGEFIADVVTKRKSAYVPELYGDILDQHDVCDDLKNERNNQLHQIIHLINSIAIQEVTAGIEAYKKKNNQLSFDDMIVKLHEALVLNRKDKLVKELQKKYKAVFVDEFQDTDRLQYEIFQQAFSTNTVLFYIGDPKQSIYAWRKADIFTYFRAYAAVDNMYDMNLNFRSSVPMIEGMNVFFQPVPGFDTFFFENAPQAIQYIPVDSPPLNSKGVLYVGEQVAVPITITSQPKNENILDAVAAQVIDLLENPAYTIGVPGKLVGITPGDLGILVRSNRQGRDIKKRLARLGIPAITIGDDRVLQSEEATYLLYLLEAMIETSRSTINKALLSPFTGFTTQNIIQLDDEKTLELFRTYKLRWDEDGVYTALRAFVTDFGVQQALLQNNTEHGERTITNLFHLIELVHKIQSGKLLSPLELVSRLKRGIEGMEIEGDEYEQRIENDEEAVKIVTIHKSKGLQYKIVLSPFMDFAEPKNATISSFRDEVSGEYVAIEKNAMTPEQQLTASKQAEQEHRRLVYVAITRAVYKCFIYRNTRQAISTLASFTDLLTNADPALIDFSLALPIPEKYRYSKSKKWEPPVAMEATNFSLSHQNWIRMSYTSLAAKASLLPKVKSNPSKDPYDQFVFQQLSRGEKTGNMLHAIFETIHYSFPEKWPEAITKAILRFAPQQKELYEEQLPNLVAHTLSARIPAEEQTFRIADVLYNKRIHEFEFDFPVPLFNTARLVELSDDKIQVNVQSAGEFEGIMNGKLDLFFEHAGKYFVLDWKSNYLGDSLQDYSQEALEKAMNEHNYHLQYLVYTLAIKKYLSTRLPAFDYEKHFGGVIYVFIRGVRSDASSGIYFVKPRAGQIGFLEQLLEEPIMTPE